MECSESWEVHAMDFSQQKTLKCEFQICLKQFLPPQQRQLLVQRRYAKARNMLQSLMDWPQGNNKIIVVVVVAIVFCCIVFGLVF